MEADFSGYATKAGLKCSDGRTIMPDAFKHQDMMTVPLVWQHSHNDPENVLGHVKLEARDDGVYAYGFFNGTVKANHTQTALEHGDFNALSIWANQLIERSKMVLHGAIKEVSLVLSGANPGALIENITIRHSDDDDETLEDEAIIFTGLTLEHSSLTDTKLDDIIVDTKIEDNKGDTKVEDNKGDTKVADIKTDDTKIADIKTDDTKIADIKTDDNNIQKVYNSMNDEQKQVLHFMLGEALNTDNSSTMDHAAAAATNAGDMTVQEVYDSMTEQQKQVLHFMIGEALQSSDQGAMGQDDLNDGDDNGTNNQKGDKEMKHNVFEDDKTAPKEAILSHSDMEGIIADATKSGSLKGAVEGYALAHGIDDVDTLFPDAVSLDKVPQYLQRRVEWVSSFLGAVRKSPFSRIKTITADLTFEDARAKGYVKGELKKEEFFGVAKRTTTPTTVYKKQAIDRDDVVDITDFDVVLWLKGEMRIMLDEELARAALMGDGRDVSHEDKINEGNIRPIASEHELFATTINVNIADSLSSVNEVVDAIVANRKYYRGTGQPNMYTSETLISMFLLLKDTLGRRIYKSVEEVAAELRVAEIIPVEVMEEDPTLLAVIVNPVDYVFGATAGGQVSMFDDFDIDYNKQKYLIETRVSGALTKLKSALVVRATAGTNVLVSPNAPTFDEDTGVLTIVNQTGVVYKNGAVVVNAAGSPYAPIASGESITIDATPASGYYFATSEDDSWTFTRN